MHHSESKIDLCFVKMNMLVASSELKIDISHVGPCLTVIKNGLQPAAV